MTRGYDYSDFADFLEHARSSQREKPAPREYPEERNPSRGAGGSSSSEGHRELPKSPDGRDLAERTRRAYRDRDRTYSLRNSELQTLTEVGKFRVVDVSDLAKFAYAGDRAWMETDIRNLERQGLAQQHRTSPLKDESRQVVTLTNRGRRFLRRHDFVRKDQALYHGIVKLKEAKHDADLYRLYQKAANEIECKGGKVSRVVLDYEFKQQLYRKLGKAQAANDPDLETRKAQFARELQLPVVEGKVVLPDMRIEYETQEDGLARVDLELASGHYHASHLAEKARAGFRIYARPEDAARLRRVRDEREITTAILSL